MQSWPRNPAAPALWPARSGPPARPPPSRRTSTTRPSAPSPSTSWSTAYYEQARGLMEGGVDLLLVETVFDTLNCQGGPVRHREVFRRDRAPRAGDGSRSPSPTCSGRTLSGQTVEAFWNSISHARLLSVGINCALGPEGDAAVHRGTVRDCADIYVSAYPNAGLPNRCCRRLSRNPGDAGAATAASGPRTAGSTSSAAAAAPRPTHIRAIAEAVRGLPPRVPPKPQPLHPPQRPGSRSTIRPETNFVNIGERTNVTGSPKFAKLILAGDYEAALAIARQQVENGAQIIDVNMDEGMLDSAKAHDHLPEPDRLRAGHRPRAGHDRQLEVVGDRGRPEVRSGQRRRQLHQPQGRRREVPATGPAGPPLRRGRGRDGLRRAGPGRHLRAHASRSASAPTAS